MNEHDPVTSIKITKIPHLDTIIIKQRGGRFFISTKNSIVIDVTGLYIIIRFLVMNHMIDPEVIERILDDYKQT
jgi:hypothetical protein